MEWEVSIGIRDRTGLVEPIVYARQGSELKRLKSSIRESRCHEIMAAKVLAEGKGIVA